MLPPVSQISPEELISHFIEFSDFFWLEAIINRLLDVTTHISEESDDLIVQPKALFHYPRDAEEHDMLVEVQVLLRLISHNRWRSESVASSEPVPEPVEDIAENILRYLQREDRRERYRQKHALFIL